MMNGLIVLLATARCDTCCHAGTQNHGNNCANPGICQHIDEAKVRNGVLRSSWCCSASLAEWSIGEDFHWTEWSLTSLLGSRVQVWVSLRARAAQEHIDICCTEWPWRLQWLRKRCFSIHFTSIKSTPLSLRFKQSAQCDSYDEIWMLFLW